MIQTQLGRFPHYTSVHHLSLRAVHFGPDPPLVESGVAPLELVEWHFPHPPPAKDLSHREQQEKKAIMRPQVESTILTARACSVLEMGGHHIIQCSGSHKHPKVSLLILIRQIAWVRLDISQEQAFFLWLATSGSRHKKGKRHASK